jgi:hypothetical protein
MHTIHENTSDTLCVQLESKTNIKMKQPQSRHLWMRGNVRLRSNLK